MATGDFVPMSKFEADESLDERYAAMEKRLAVREGVRARACSALGRPCPCPRAPRAHCGEGAHIRPADRAQAPEPAADARGEGAGAAGAASPGGTAAAVCGAPLERVPTGSRGPARGLAAAAARRSPEVTTAE
jgi:hypothetical protein